MPPCGITPDRIAALIFVFFAETSAWFVNAPPEFVLPAPWQLLLIEQTEVRIGCTSAANFGLIPAQEKVIPPPAGGAGVPLLLQAVNTITAKKIRDNTINMFFIK